MDMSHISCVETFESLRHLSLDLLSTQHQILVETYVHVELKLKGVKPI